MATSQQTPKPEHITEENAEEGAGPKSPQLESPQEEKGTEQKESNSKVATENDVSNELVCNPFYA